MSNGPLIPQEVAARTIADALRGRVGRGTRYSCQGLSDRTGIPTRTIESYQAGTATPGFGNLLTLCSVLGPSFTSDLLRPCDQTARAGSADDPEHMRVVSDMASLTGVIADALADGHVDHREAAQIRPVAQALIEALEPLARAQGGGA